MNSKRFHVDRPLIITDERKNHTGASYDYEALEEKVPLRGYHMMFRDIGVFTDLSKDQIRAFNKMSLDEKKVFCRDQLVLGVRDLLEYLENGGEE